MFCLHNWVAVVSKKQVKINFLYNINNNFSANTFLSTNIHTYKTHLSYTKNILSLLLPMWNPHPTKEASLQKPSPFKGKTLSLEKGRQRHWKDHSICSFISMWDFNPPFHPSLSQIPQAANSGTVTLAEPYY